MTGEEARKREVKGVDGILVWKILGSQPRGIVVGSYGKVFSASSFDFAQKFESLDENWICAFR